MSKHTPGLWHVGSKLTVGPRSKEDDQSFGMVLPLADVYGSDAEANAILIAAAPELLAALVAFEEFGNVMRVRKQISAAIAKATGKS